MSFNASISKLRQHSDRVIAAVCFACSISVAFVAYTALLEEEHPHELILSSMPLGRADYFVVNHAACVGELSSQLVENEGFQADISASLRVLVASSVDLAKLTASTRFNSLMQMTESKIAFSYGKFFIRINSLGANPVQLSISTNIIPQEAPQELSLSGPVLLRKQDGQRYSLEYTAMTRTKQEYMRVLAEPALNELRQSELELLPRALNSATTGPQNGLKCSSENSAALDLSAPITKLSALLASFLGERRDGKQAKTL